MIKNLGLLLYLFPFLLWGEEQKNLQSKINFTNVGVKSPLPEDYGYYSELRKWANFQKMKLQKDSRRGEIHDGVCQMIPPTGFSFYLEAQKDIKKRIFLYLDLTTYSSESNSNFPTRALHVYIGNKAKKVVYFRPGNTEENPAEIPIDPSDIERNRINIRLIPDHTEGGRFWGIWDAYYTTEKEKP
jgi:hypothetical protein